MRTGILHPLRVRKRLCVSVLGGKQSVYFSRFRKYFVVFGVFVKQIVISNSVFGFVVLNSIWEHVFNIFFDIFRKQNQKSSQKCEQFSYGTFGGMIVTHERPDSAIPTLHALYSQNGHKQKYICEMFQK